MKYTCTRCDMSFHVVDRFPSKGDVSRCGEKVCRMQMHSMQPRHAAVVISVLASVAEGRGA